MRRLALSTIVSTMLLVPAVESDEGMWLFNDPPRALLKSKYGFEPTDEWLEHVQKSSVRFNSGGSGSFVSEDGLVMSNHHVGADSLQKLSTEKDNYLRDGFYARTREEELKCHDLELNVLMSIVDVTERVTAAVKGEMSAEEAFAARRAVMAEIEKESLEKTGLRSDVITLFQGGKYHLYQFKKYTDVRLVWAPDQQIAFFGGDPDNFEYPRYCLDVCFFRAYEDGKPAKVEHYLKWSENGPKENELILVSGHPGGTSRLLTMEELAYKRDVQFPFTMEFLNRAEVMLSVYSSQSAENARRAKDELFGVQNSRKARQGGLAGLLDPALMGRKAAEEQRLRAALKQKGGFEAALAAYEKIASAQNVIRENVTRYNLLERGLGFRSRYFDIGQTLLRAAEERGKPNGDRLREFRDSAKESLELQLFSEEPLYDDFEQAKLEDSLTFLVAKLGFQDGTVKKVLGGKSPRERAGELVRGTKLKSVEQRRKWYAGEAAELKKADDAMLQLAQMIDDEARAVRKVIEAQDEIKRQAYGEIAKARFAVEGSSSYPDATFTLRLAYGQAKGYEEDGKQVPYQTVLAGLYERAAEQNNEGPFKLPEIWAKKKSAIDLNTPINFVSTADIIGGNSGSPTINQKGEIVGLIFDGNIYSLVLDFAYTDVKARALSVHSKGITEAMEKVYGAGDLVKEILGRK